MHKRSQRVPYKTSRRRQRLLSSRQQYPNFPNGKQHYPQPNRPQYNLQQARHLMRRHMPKTKHREKRSQLRNRPAHFLHQYTIHHQPNPNNPLSRSKQHNTISRQQKILYTITNNSRNHKYSGNRAKHPRRQRYRSQYTRIRRTQSRKRRLHTNISKQRTQ